MYFEDNRRGKEIISSPVVLTAVSLVQGADICSGRKLVMPLSCCPGRQRLRFKKITVVIVAFSFLKDLQCFFKHSPHV